MSLKIAEREITKILVVDDEKAGREGYRLTVEDADLETILQEEKTENVDKFLQKLNAQDAVVSDHHLRRASSYFPIDGAELVSRCFKLHIPSVLVTKYELTSLHEIRLFRSNIPVVLTPDEFTPDSLVSALTACIDEFNGRIPANRKAWRTLIRIDQCEDSSAVVFVPSWNAGKAIDLKKYEFPEKLWKILTPDLRIFAKVNIGAENVLELFFTDWEF
jgi:CheY-like chemotaxis protein